MSHLVHVLPLVLLTACASEVVLPMEHEPIDNTPVEQDAEPTITQGVLINARSVSWGADDGVDSSRPLVDATVRIEVPLTDGGWTMWIELTTDGGGFAEYALEPGDYRVVGARDGTGAEDAQELTVEPGAIVDCSYVLPAGLGPAFACRPYASE